MKFQISEELDRILKKSDKPIRNQILKKIEKILDNPECGKPLKHDLHNLRSERIGKLRILYEIKDDLIVFHTCKHRKKVYK